MVKEDVEAVMKEEVEVEKEEGGGGGGEGGGRRRSKNSLSGGKNSCESDHLMT